MKRTKAAWACIFAVGLAVVFLQPLGAERASSLAAVEANITKAFPDVAVMPTADLETIEQSGQSVILFDARSEEEFAVSRIKGARRVEPGMSVTQFQNEFGADLKGRKIVVYCAVGQRSSVLASRIKNVAKQAGADGVYSLQGGIFRWHNERRPLVGPVGATDEVHPFSANAARLIERQEGVAYVPGSSKSAKVD
ncbi:MAG: rhodanese-like domain-containing protein [Hyphomicrobium sp.]|nr:rhodanese-like domain-containing protein [Hyphomicrobium sp.]